MQIFNVSCWKADRSPLGLIFGMKKAKVAKKLK